MSENIGIKTIDGKFHAGMTLKQAQNSWDYQVLKNYSQIDKNKDNLLSADEILINRKDKTKSQRNKALFWGLVTIPFYFFTKKAYDVKNLKDWFKPDSLFFIPPITNVIATLATSAVNFINFNINSKENAIIEAQLANNKQQKQGTKLDKISKSY